MVNAKEENLIRKRNALKNVLKQFLETKDFGQIIEDILTIFKEELEK